jgi:hypothetical protein
MNKYRELHKEELRRLYMLIEQVSLAVMLLACIGEVFRISADFIVITTEISRVIFSSSKQLQGWYLYNRFPPNSLEFINHLTVRS